MANGLLLLVEYRQGVGPDALAQFCQPGIEPGHLGGRFELLSPGGPSGEIQCFEHSTEKLKVYEI